MLPNPIQTRGQIMPTTLLLGTRGSKILTQALTYLLTLSLEILKGAKAYLPSKWLCYTIYVRLNQTFSQLTLLADIKRCFH